MDSLQPHRHLRQRSVLLRHDTADQQRLHTEQQVPGHVQDDAQPTDVLDHSHADLRRPADSSHRRPILLRPRPSDPVRQGAAEAEEDPNQGGTLRAADYNATVAEEAEQEEVHEVWLRLRSPGRIRKAYYEWEDHEEVQIQLVQQ